MRYAVVTLRPPPDGFSPVDRLLRDDPEVDRRTLNQLNVLNNGTAVFLYEVDGDCDRVAELLESDPHTLAYQVSATADGCLVYTHTRPQEPAADVLAILDEHEIVLDTPMTYVDGGLRMTVFGSNDAIQTAADAVPDAVRVTVERTGDYDATGDAPIALLTQNQRETLRVAMLLGYYDVPRRTTHEAIADERGRSPSAIGEQLQRIEKTVFDSVTPW